MCNIISRYTNYLLLKLKSYLRALHDFWLIKYFSLLGFPLLLLFFKKSIFLQSYVTHLQLPNFSVENCWTCSLGRTIRYLLLGVILHIPGGRRYRLTKWPSTPSTLLFLLQWTSWIQDFLALFVFRYNDMTQVVGKDIFVPDRKVRHK